MEKSKLQFLAYYLPQYHPISENDQWWGKGFTEWTNVAKAKPLFKGHYQPILPADLGFYDLRVPQVQEAQSEMALKYGIDGFIYYQYWFGNGKMLLEKPAEAMLENKNIKIPFCFCWANETWKGIWHGLDNPDVLIKQTYNGVDDYKRYFEYLLPFFRDERYIKEKNKPMFHIYRVEEIPDLDLFLDTFNEEAIKAGFEGICFVVTRNRHYENLKTDERIRAFVGIDGFEAIRYSQKTFLNRYSILGKIENKIYKWVGYSDQVGARKKPLILDYQRGVKELVIEIPHDKYIPCIFPNWDNSARAGNKSLIFKNTTPELWGEYIRKTIEALQNKEEVPQIVILKSWNEWAEGNYLEPDRKFGFAWLEEIKKIRINI